MANLLGLRLWMNCLGLVLSGAGTILLAYIVFSFKNIMAKEEQAYCIENETVSINYISKFMAYSIKTSNLNKLSIALIAFGVILQIFSLIVEP